MRARSYIATAWRRGDNYLRPCALVFVAVLSLLASCDHPQRKAARTLCQGEVEEGDILLRLGCTPESQLVIALDHGVAYSHIGLAIEVEGVMMAAHVVPGEEQPEYVKYEPLADFFHKDRSLAGAVGRFSLTDKQKAQLRERALQLIHQRILFDHQYDDSDAQQLYCTEFIWCVYAALGIDVSAGQRRAIKFLWIDAQVMLPSHVYHHPQLQIVQEF